MRIRPGRHPSRRTAALATVVAALAAALAAGPATAAVFHVSPTGTGSGTAAEPAGLQAALTAAQGNGEDDTINLMQGTYTGNFTYVGAAGEAGTLHVDGGWNADYSNQASDPANTILDGNLSGRVLTLDNATNAATGMLFVEGVTIRNGLVAGANGGGLLAAGYPPTEIVLVNNIFEDNDTNQHGGGFFVYSHEGTGQTGDEIMILNNIVRNNQSGTDDVGPIFFGGGGYVSTAKGAVLQNNLVHDNAARGTVVNSGSGGGLYVSVLGGQLLLLHNTIVANSGYQFGGGIVLHGPSWSPADVTMANNIIRGNTVTATPGSGDVHNDLSNAQAGSNFAVLNNDYHFFYSWTGDPSGSLVPALSGNIDLDPAFDGATGYRLTAGSPAVDTGAAGVAGGVPVDLAWFPRSWDGDGDGTAVPDMGAWELGTSSEGHLLSPVGGEVLPSGDIFPVFWHSPAVPGDVRTRVQYSLNDGKTWKRAGPDTFKSYLLWQVPAPARNQRRCRLRVTGYDAATGARLGGGRTGRFAIEVVKLTEPNGGQTFVSGRDVPVGWQANATIRPAARAVLSYTLDGGSHWKKIGEAMLAPGAPGASGFLFWTIPQAAAPKSRCRVKVVLKDAAGRTVGSDASDRYFTIGAVHVLAPDGGETLTTGDVASVSWVAADAADTFDLHYSLNKGRTWKPIATGVAVSPYAWTVPALARNSSQCLVRVTGFRSSNGRRVGVDVSDRTFTVEVVALTAPNSGNQVRGAPVTVTWKIYDTVAPVDAIQLSYSVDKGASWKRIVELPGAAADYDWAIPDVLRRKASFKVKIVLRSATGKIVGSDASDSWMKILGP